jgi:hypothetical protein
MELVDIAISAIAESAASKKRFSWSGMVDPLGFPGAGYRWVHCGGRQAGRTQLRSTDQVGDGTLGGVGRCSSQTREVCTACAREQFGNESVARLMRKCKRTGGYQESTPISAGRVSLGMETKKRFPISMRMYSLRLTRLHSSVGANRHSRSAPLVLHLLFAER